MELKMSNTLDFSKTKALEIVKNEHCAIKELHSDNIFTFPDCKFTDIAI